MLCGIWTCTEPKVSGIGIGCQQISGHNILSVPLAHHLSSFIFSLCLFLASLYPHAHLTSHSTTIKGAGCITCCAPAESPVHHKDLAIWSAPSAIKTGSVYTWGRTLFLPFSFCLSRSVYPLSVLHTERQRTRAYTVPGYRALVIETSARLWSDWHHSSSCNRWWWGARSMFSVLCALTLKSRWLQSIVYNDYSHFINIFEEKHRNKSFRYGVMGNKR